MTSPPASAAGLNPARDVRGAGFHVSVGIVGFRNPGDIVRCLTGLAKSTYRDFEVVICENGGQAACEALIAAIPSTLDGGQPVRVVCAPGNLGYGGGVNVCLAETPQADAWWILNPDACPEPEAMAALVARLRSGDCDAVGGVIYFPDGRVESYGGHWGRWLARPRSIGHGSAREAAVDAKAVERRLSYVSGASMMVGRRFVETVGPLREDYFLYCEEVEWFLRGAQAGMRLGFAPAARVMHEQGTTTGSAPDLRARPRAPVYLDTRNKVLVTRDRFPGRLPVAAAAVLAVMALRCAKHGAWRQLGYAVDGWRAGLFNERGAPSWLAR